MQPSVVKKNETKHTIYQPSKDGFFQLKICKSFGSWKDNELQPHVNPRPSPRFVTLKSFDAACAEFLAKIHIDKKAVNKPKKKASRKWSLNKSKSQKILRQTSAKPMTRKPWIYQTSCSAAVWGEKNERKFVPLSHSLSFWAVSQTISIDLTLSYTKPLTDMPSFTTDWKRKILTKFFARKRLSCPLKDRTQRGSTP